MLLILGNMHNSQVELKTLNSYSAAEFNINIYMPIKLTFSSLKTTWFVTLTTINSAVINRK